MRSLFRLVVAAVVFASFAYADPPAPGPFCKATPEAHRKAETWQAGKVLLGTSYFYWYDAPTGCHVINPGGGDALTHHPAPDRPALSWKSVEWHEAQLRDIARAGVDFMMPVYWGVPGQKDSWSNEGLPPLVKAHDNLLAARARDAKNPKPAQIGLFYDTSTLWFNKYQGCHLGEGPRQDLTTPEGRAWFYNTIRDFFSFIPPEKWARIDGRPIVFLYAGAFARAMDEKLFDDTRQRFEKDFGCGVYIVRHADWPGKADAWYQWGGACRVTLGDVTAGIGPGYDHSAVPGRTPLIVERRDGKFYQEQWELLLRMDPQRRPWLIHVETWNEFHEGTDIAPSKEYGDQYVLATAKYGKAYREGKQVPSTGKYAKARKIAWRPKEKAGITPIDQLDGCMESVELNGKSALRTKGCTADQVNRYLYFDVDDGFLFSSTGVDVEVTVKFLDDGSCEQLRIEYDNNDQTIGPRAGAFRPTDAVPVGNTGQWREHTFKLPNVRFVNACNTADFRLSPEGGKFSLTVSEIVMKKRKAVK